MISGVDLGKDKRTASQVELLASATTAGKIEIWLDDLKKGKLIATLPITSTGVNNWKTFEAAVKNISGRPGAVPET